MPQLAAALGPLLDAQGRLAAGGLEGGESVGICVNDVNTEGAAVWDLGLSSDPPTHLNLFGVTPHSHLPHLTPPPLTGGWAVCLTASPSVSSARSHSPACRGREWI